MLRLNDCLRRSATERWARSKSQWSQFDGIVRATDATRPYLQTQRLGRRPYSVSALQNYAYCPYRFLLSAHLQARAARRARAAAAARSAHERQPVPRSAGRVLQSASTGQENDCDDANRDGARSARRDADAHRRQVRRRGGARRRSRVAGRDREHAHRSSRVGAHLAETKEWEPWLFEYAFGLPNEVTEPGAHAPRDPNSLPIP